MNTAVMLSFPPQRWAWPARPPPSGDLAFRHSTLGEYLAGHAVARDPRHLKRADKRPVQTCVLFAPEHRGSRTTPRPARVA